MKPAKTAIFWLSLRFSISKPRRDQKTVDYRGVVYRGRDKSRLSRRKPQLSKPAQTSIIQNLALLVSYRGVGSNMHYDKEERGYMQVHRDD